VIPLDELRARLAKHSESDPSSGCRVWKGKLNGNGYGVLVLKRRGERLDLLAHRLAYELERGRIGDGLEIDHLCRNRRCINTDHLEAVTKRVNVLRGDGPTARNARKTHCQNGHPFDEANTMKRGQSRKCRICHAADSRRYRSKKRE
jgi:hypothetical protein